MNLDRQEARNRGKVDLIPDQTSGFLVFSFDEVPELIGAVGAGWLGGVGMAVGFRVGDARALWRRVAIN
jgi:hypothetical protein